MTAEEARKAAEQSPVFPCERQNADGSRLDSCGLSVRMWLIGMALCGRADFVRGRALPDNEIAVLTAQSAIALADAVLAELAKESEVKP